MPDAELKSDAIILRRDEKFIVWPGFGKGRAKGTEVHDSQLN